VDFDPDWGRVGARPPNQFEKVGDPTRWGATDRTNIVVNAFNQSSSQVLQIVTRDPYARSWALLGTLSMPVSVWTTAQMIASLVVTEGVGQIQLVQEIALWIGPGSAGGPGGIVYQQDSLNGGVYLVSDVFFVQNSAGVQIAYQTRAFAIVGGLVGQSIAIRGKYGTIGANPDLPSPALLSLIATPFAAGEGL
jgi:hypothetical protein